MWLCIAILCFAGANGVIGGRLHVSGTHLVKDGHRVFLNGVNQAWVNYAHDFGNHQYSGVRNKYTQTLNKLHASGGNSIRVWLHIEGLLQPRGEEGNWGTRRGQINYNPFRVVTTAEDAVHSSTNWPWSGLEIGGLGRRVAGVWLHIEGDTSPHFTSDGHVDKTDSQGSLISDMRTFLHDAQHYNILVFFVLWNGAKKQSNHYRLNGLIRDTGKLQSYIDHALVPMVKALKSEPALGGWEIINEPEGEIKLGLHSSNPCYDTTKLSGSGAGWEGHLYSAQELQRFINWQADAIRRADPGAMVTVGSWNAKANTDRFGFHNLWKDSCLTQAGGRHSGTLTFYQFHTYSWQGKWDGYSPMQHNFNDYGLNKPLVIGEFRQSDGAGMSIQDMYNHAYYYGYSGAWGWQAVEGNWGNLQHGISWLKGRNDQAKGGQVNLSL